jgi:hypothetical protein
MPLPAALFTNENAKAARDTLRALRRRVLVVPVESAIAQNR